MTPRQFWNKLIGWRRIEDIKFRDDWDRAWWIAYRLTLPHADHKKQFTPKELVPHPFDSEETEKPKAPEPTRDRFEYLKEKWATK